MESTKYKTLEARLWNFLYNLLLKNPPCLTNKRFKRYQNINIHKYKKWHLKQVHGAIFIIFSSQISSHPAFGWYPEAVLYIMHEWWKSQNWQKFPLNTETKLWLRSSANWCWKPCCTFVRFFRRLQERGQTSMDSIIIPDICHEPHEHVRVNFFGRCKFLQI